MFVMVGELPQIDIEVTERLQTKAVDKETETQEEIAKARRALITSTPMVKDSHGRASKGSEVKSDACGGTSRNIAVLRNVL
jgi:hypothetical protein